MPRLGQWCRTRCALAGRLLIPRLLDTDGSQAGPTILARAFNTYMHTYIRRYVCVRAYHMYTYMHMCHMCLYIYRYTHTCVCVHTHRDTHMLTCRGSLHWFTLGPRQKIFGHFRQQPSPETLLSPRAEYQNAVTLLAHQDQRNPS